MDLLGVLEKLAASEQTSEGGTDVTDIHRYQEIFDVGADEARSRIEAHEKGLSDIRDTKAGLQPLKVDKMVYLVKQEGPLQNEVAVRGALRSDKKLQIHRGERQHTDAFFFEMSAENKIALCDWLSEHHPQFRPTVVLVNMARKELSVTTLAPFLGMDTSLPQHRPNAADFQARPSQTEWPVWCFFYGKLAESEKLGNLLDLADEPEYFPAHTFGGVLKILRGNYRVLIDGDVDDRVDGSAFLVESREHEDMLRAFETNAYEVVRCDIHFENRIEAGLVFRFCGDHSALL